jgi:methyl-accepting chemotaxis protein
VAVEISILSRDSVAVVESAGGLLTKIVPDIQKTAGLMQEISAASREQSVGAQQVQEAMTQPDSVIQPNSASAEELAAASEELAGHASTLREAISFFRIADEEDRGRAASAAAE